MTEESGSGEGMRHVRAVPPEVETLLSVRVPPESVCYLSHPAVPNYRMQLDADDQGIVQFHARARRGAQPIELELRFLSPDGQETMHTVAVSADATHGRPAGAHSGGPRPEARGQVRPALDGDPMAPSNQELVTRGYPPRPDPVRRPAQYARWLRNVSQQYSVGHRRVAHPDVTFARQDLSGERLLRNLPPVLASPTLPLPPPIAATLFNSSWDTWSGAYLTQPGMQFDHVQAEWIVPRVFGDAGAPVFSAAAKWVGLDNGGTDLFQSGTDSECFIPWPGWTLTSYWMWIETLPFGPWGAPVAVSPGDEVSVTIFVADQNGTTWFGENGGLTPADNSVWFMLYNETQHGSYWGTLPTAPQSEGGLSSTGYTGSTAEFILERPSYNNSPVPLANFLITEMDDCWYGDSLYENDLFPLGANGSTPWDGNLQYINMVNNGNLLAIPVSVPDPDSGPTSYQIIWWWANYQ